MRRQIAPYPTRIALDHSKIYGPLAESGPYFVCMTESDIELYVALLGYAKRRVQWAKNLTESAAYYEGLTDDEWLALNDNINDLEGRLMAVICQEDIVDALVAIMDTLGPLQCLCNALMGERVGTIYGDDIAGLIEGGKARPIHDVPSETIPPQVDVDACAIAQLYWAWTFEVVTEQILPAWDSAFDDLIPILAGIIGEIVGPAPGDGIPVYAFAEMIQELIEIGYSSARENLVNWLYAVKEEWVCEAYLLIKEGSSSTAIAAAVKANIIDTALDISFGDKVVLAFIGGPWAVSLAKRAFENETIWSTDNVEPGFCDDCDPVDPECLDFVGDPEEDWFSTHEPAIRDNEPTCLAGGVIWHENGSLVPTAFDGNRWEFTVVGKAGAGTISYTIKLRTNGAPPLNFVIYNGTVEGGEVKEISGTFSTSQPGEMHFCQINSSPYQTGWRKMCIRPPL